MTDVKDLSVTVRKTIPAPAKAVFEAWLDPKMLARFMTPGEGMTVPKAEADPREGGRFTIIMAAGDQEIPHHGTYRQIDPHQTLVFTWKSPFSDPDSTVTLNFTPKGENATDIELVHVKFPSEESRANHEGGWTVILEALTSRLAA